MRMLSPALRRNIGNRPFQDFQQRLLNAFTRNISCDGRVFILAGDLVDLINIDDALLSLFQVAIGVLEKLQNNVFHIFADVTRFG